jgi:hypothetical protein
MDNFSTSIDPNGIATITFDVPGRRMNTVTIGV